MLSTLLLATAAVLPAARALTWQQQANVTGEAAECSWEEFPALDALVRGAPPTSSDLPLISFPFAAVDLPAQLGDC